jgi:hypothetical protein
VYTTFIAVCTKVLPEFRPEMETFTPLPSNEEAMARPADLEIASTTVRLRCTGVA